METLIITLLLSLLCIGAVRVAKAPRLTKKQLLAGAGTLLVAASVGTYVVVQTGAGPIVSQISGDLEYINTSQAYIGATPRIARGSSDIFIDFQSKLSSLNVTAAFCFNKSYLTPTSLQLYNPRNITIQNTYVCNGNVTFNASHFWCTNSTTGSAIFDHDYTSGNASNKTAFWNSTAWTNYTEMGGNFAKMSINYDGKDTCYYKTNISLVAGTTYSTKLHVIVPGIVANDYDGKYGVAFYPSSYGTNVSGAITDGLFYYLDPSFLPLTTATALFNDTLIDDNATIVSTGNWTYAIAGTDILRTALGAYMPNGYTTASLVNASINYSRVTGIQWDQKSTAFGGSDKQINVRYANSTTNQNMITFRYDSGNFYVFYQDGSVVADTNGNGVCTRDSNFHTFSINDTGTNFTLFCDGVLEYTWSHTTTKPMTFRFESGGGTAGATNFYEKNVLIVTNSTSSSGTPANFTQQVTNQSVKTYWSQILFLQFNVTNSTDCFQGNFTSNDTAWPINNTTGKINVTGPNASKSGFSSVNVSNKDSCGNSFSQYFTINATNDSIKFGTLLSASYTVNHNSTPVLLNFTVNATSSSPNCVVQNYASNNTNFYVNLTTGNMSLPGGNISKTGAHSVYFNATDNCSNTINQTVLVNITNTAPTVTCTNVTFRYYRNITSCSASDQDNDVLNLSANNSRITTNASGVFYTRNNQNDVGYWNTIIGASDTNINTTTVQNINITDYSTTVVALCPNIPRLVFKSNVSLIANYPYNQSQLANGTTMCTFILNASLEESPMKYYVFTNYTNATYVIQWQSTNLTTTETLMNTVNPGGIQYINLTGYWINAMSTTFPIRLYVNVTV